MQSCCQLQLVIHFILPLNKGLKQGCIPFVIPTINKIAMGYIQNGILHIEEQKIRIQSKAQNVLLRNFMIECCRKRSFCCVKSISHQLVNTIYVDSYCLLSIDFSCI